MQTRFRGLIGLAMFCGYVALAGNASASASKLVPLDKNTFSVTRQASTGFTRDTTALKSQAMDDATKYCSSHGKQLKVVTVSEDRPFYTLGFATVRVVFKALDAGDPELTAAPPALPSVAAVTAVESQSAGPGDLYAELIKLDDLHKRGILTDKEFESEKKKALRRSK